MAFLYLIFFYTFKTDLAIFNHTDNAAHDNLCEQRGDRKEREGSSGNKATAECTHLRRLSVSHNAALKMSVSRNNHTNTRDSASISRYIRYQESPTVNMQAADGLLLAQPPGARGRAGASG